MAEKMTAIEQEAQTARLMIEAGGRKAFVLIAEIDGDRVSLSRAISEGTTKREGISWIAALNRERDRVAKLIGVNPDDYTTGKA